MSLFTEPELPLASSRSSGPASASEGQPDCLDQEAQVRPRRYWRWWASCGCKGFTVLAVVTLISMMLVMYARERLHTVMTHTFAHNYMVLASPVISPWQMERQESDEHRPTLSPFIKEQMENFQDSVKRGEQGGDDGTAGNSVNGETEHQQQQEDAEDVNADKNEHFEDEDYTVLAEEFDPMPDMILHYLWCGNRFFDFRNYLSFKSAVDALQPQQVMFHHSYLPMTDPNGYFTWFDILRDQYPNLVLVKLNTTQFCYSGGYKRYVLLFDILQRYGGIYLPEDAILLRIAERFRTMSFVSGISSCSLRYFSEGIVIARKGEFKIPTMENGQVRMLSVCNDENSLHPCATEERYMAGNASYIPSCVRLATSLFPKNIWTASDRVSSLANLIAYGKTDLAPRHSHLISDRTPPIAHYLCIDDCSLSFSLFLSILSALHVAGLKRVLIHGPKAPSGVWWERLLKEQGDVVQYLHREFSFANDPTLKMTNQMRYYIMRTEILLHYGGVFHDSHVIWTQPLPEQLLEYEAVASPDWHAHGNWPESVNHALLIARGGAQYLQQLLKMYHQQSNTESPWIAEHYLSYRLIELDPTLVYLYPHLQVKCLNHNCHPPWQPGYRSHFLLNRPGSQFDWRTETLSVHWVDTFPELDVDQVKFTSGFIVDIATHALKAAGLDLKDL